MAAHSISSVSQLFTQRLRLIRLAACLSCSHCAGALFDQQCVSAAQAALAAHLISSRSRLLTPHLRLTRPIKALLLGVSLGLSLACADSNLSQPIKACWHFRGQLGGIFPLLRHIGFSVLVGLAAIACCSAEAA